MKWILASDLHGSTVYIEKLMQCFEKENAERMFFLGDYLYHGPRNTIPAGYDTIQAAEILNRYKEYIFCIRGNCDSDVDQMMLDFPILSENAYLDFDGTLAFASHGHVFHKENLPKLKKGEIFIQGHTHVPSVEELENGIVFMNPGSVSIPKGGSENSYILYENGCFRWKTLDGKVFLEYRIG